MFSRQIGIDLGTVNVLVHEKGAASSSTSPRRRDLGERQPDHGGRGRGAGDAGPAPDTIEVARPMRDGVIADYVVTEAMLRYFITKVCGRMPLFKPEVMISVPVGVTSVESRAVHEAAEQAGARAAYLVPEPMAAALGAGLPVGTPTGNMVLNMGGGTSEAAVIS